MIDKYQIMCSLKISCCSRYPSVKFFSSFQCAHDTTWHSRVTAFKPNSNSSKTANTPIWIWIWIWISISMTISISISIWIQVLCWIYNCKSPCVKKEKIITHDWPRAFCNHAIGFHTFLSISTLPPRTNKVLFGFIPWR